MRWVDMKDSLKSFWSSYRRQKAGMLGLVLLLLLIFVAIAAPWLTNPDVPKVWQVGNPLAPRNAPPTWINAFSHYKQAPHEEIYLSKYLVGKNESMGYTVYAFKIEYLSEYDYPPKDIVFTGLNSTAKNPTEAPSMSMVIERPHEPGVKTEELKLFSDVQIPSGAVIQVASLPDAKANVLVWLAENGVYKLNIPEGVPPDMISYLIMQNQTLFGYMSSMDIMWVIFQRIIDDKGHLYPLQDVLFHKEPRGLKGTYTFYVTIKVPSNVEVDYSNAKLILVGRTYGFMGTDQMGRDIWADLLWGVRVSLYIGLAVSISSVLVGVLYGVVSAYLGGWKDEALQRFNEFMASIPVFPILILLGMYFGGHITINLLIGLLVLFGWMGTAKVARSMALQIKEQTYIEAARALGASTWRVVFRHIVPQLLPYAFASIAISVPGAILSEAGLSFLGLGDPTAVTWGQMLNAAQQNNATLNGYWWQVLPPGLAIALVGFVFVLIGVSLDTVLNPKLKRV